jgi:hypothetical protein
MISHHYSLNKVILATLILLTLAGCTQPNIPAPSNLQPPHVFRIDNVPFVKQKPYYCAPASAEMVLNYYQVTQLSQDDIAECDAGNATGTHWSKLVSYLNSNGKEYGIAADTVYGDLNLLKQYVSSGYPVLVRQWKNNNKPYKHYRVVIGYDDSRRQILFHDADERPDLEMDYDAFIELWDIKSNRNHWTSKNLMIVIAKIKK